MRLLELWTPEKFHRWPTWDPDRLHILFRQRRIWRILWNFGNLTPYGTEGGGELGEIGVTWALHVTWAPVIAKI